jgi:putrescine transport system ATP-binding protein
VTHDQEEAMTVADRIGVMNGGRLIQVATPPEIYEQPNSRWVAEFIGNANVIEATVTEAGANATTVASIAAGAMRTGAASGAKPGDIVWVSLRPEKIRIAPGHAETAWQQNHVVGVVWDIGYLGDVSIYKVRLASGFVMEVAVANMTRRINQPIQLDDAVTLTWSPEAAVVLMR